MKRKLAFLTAFFISSFLFAQEEINKTDAKGNRHGLWKGIHEKSKRPRYEGTFINGKETGVFKFFDDTNAGTVIATRDFSKKDNSCYTTFFDQKGNKVSEGKEINKLAEGEWKYYHKGSPAIMTVENYSKGKINGIRKVYYKNGALAEEAEYKNSLKDGFYKKYTEKGIVLEEAFYKKDKLHGPVIYRDTNGQIIVKGQFTDNRKSGVWHYFENGKLVKEEDKGSIKP